MLRVLYISAFTTLFSLFALLAMPDSAFAQSNPSYEEIAEALRGGGYVIAMRHGATHQDQADTDPLNLANIAQQRQLNKKGEDAAKALGKAFRDIGIPVNKVITSHFNRAYVTAQLAGFKNIEKSFDITEGGLIVSPIENRRRAEAFRALASTVPPKSSNTVIVSHKPNTIAAFGKDWFEVKEGEASIFIPDGSGYKLFARVQMDEWPRIAEAVKK